MRFVTGLLCVFAASVSPAAAGGFFGDIVKGATGIDVEKGEVCIINQCIDKGGKTRTKSFDEVLEDKLNGVPGYTLLSEPDRDNVKAAAKAGAVFTAATTLDPITGGIVIKMIVGDQEQEVAVPSYNPTPPPTPIKYTMVASCLFQRSPTELSAGFSAEAPTELSKVRPGDTVSLTAEFCPGLGGTSVTSVTMVATSEATSVQNNPKFSWVLLGKVI